MTREELHAKYYVECVKLKKKGAGKGYKKIVSVKFNESMSRKEYLREFAEIDRMGCGIFLCKIEQQEMQDDRWWDIPSYRDEAIRDYRSRIKTIRAEYGLSKSAVAEFMKVD